MSILHESVLSEVLQRLSTRTKCVLLSTCKELRSIGSRSELWSSLEFSSVEDQSLEPADLIKCLERGRGNIRVLRFARSEEARMAQSARRFHHGYKCTQQSPYTQGLRTLALTALLPNLQYLSLDERTSCIGGMTDDLARAMSWNCVNLERLEVFFEPYSWPSELFTDDGLITIAERCKNLRAVVLHNCTYITDRSLYSFAANCKKLEEIDIAGYYERITDSGLAVLSESCVHLRVVNLCSKLWKVTDIAVTALARNSSALQVVTLPRTITDAGVIALLHNCSSLTHLDLSNCSNLTDISVKALAAISSPTFTCKWPVFASPCTTERLSDWLSGSELEFAEPEAEVLAW